MCIARLAITIFSLDDDDEKMDLINYTSLITHGKFCLCRKIGNCTHRSDNR